MGGTVPALSGRVVLATDVHAEDLIRRAQPLKPAPSKLAPIRGFVCFVAVLTKDGHLQNITLVNGHPLLVEAARRATVHHEYEPILLNGQPIDVIVEIDVNVTLRRP